MFEQFGNMMETIKKMQQNVNLLQEKLRNEYIEVKSGDVLKVVVNGQQDILSIELNPQYLSAEHGPLLQDLLATTLNNALAKSRDLQESAMGQLSNELNLPNIPGIFK